MVGRNHSTHHLYLAKQCRRLWGRRRSRGIWRLPTGSNVARVSTSVSNRNALQAWKRSRRCKSTSTFLWPRSDVWLRTMVNLSMNTLNRPRKGPMNNGWPPTTRLMSSTRRWGWGWTASWRKLVSRHFRFSKQLFSLFLLTKTCADVELLYFTFRLLGINWLEETDSAKQSFAAALTRVVGLVEFYFITIEKATIFWVFGHYKLPNRLFLEYLMRQFLNRYSRRNRIKH